MASASCALCGAGNSLARVYLGMQSPRPNLIAISCTSCGKVSSQLLTLGDYVLFALGYGAISLVLIVIGMRVAGPDTGVGWIALISAIVPFTFLPAVWAMWRADELGAGAPREDLTLAEKLVYLSIAIALIAVMIGGGLFAYLRWVA